MADLEREKAAAALRAVDEVRAGMLVGLGTGSTAAYAVRELGRRVAQGLQIIASASSLATENLARECGLRLQPFAELTYLDIAIDGADEIDPQLAAIKGGGGALLREKIIATAAKRMVVVVDSSKPVLKLGRFKLPVEVLPFGVKWIEKAVSTLGAPVSLRRQTDGSTYVTDQGNYILDTAFAQIEDASSLAGKLDAIPGVLEHGLFLNEIDAVYIGRGDDVEMKTRTRLKNSLA